MKKRVVTAKTIAEFRKCLILEERSAATIEKYIRDVKVLQCMPKMVKSKKKR